MPVPSISPIMQSIGARPAYLRPRAAVGTFPYPHRTLAQVAQDEEREAFAGLPSFLRRMIIASGDRA